MTTRGAMCKSWSVSPRGLVSAARVVLGIRGVPALESTHVHPSHHSSTRANLACIAHSSPRPRIRPPSAPSCPAILMRA